MKTTFYKLKPKIINYRKYEHFYNGTFKYTFLLEHHNFELTAIEVGLTIVEKSVETLYIKVSSS